jgi:3',5'-cyclic AMP phosphodiesterase CpdA
LTNAFCPGLTTEQTVRRIVGAAGFRTLVPGPGEPARPRTELIADSHASAEPPEGATGEQVLRLLHLTDFQLADLASPARLEHLRCRTGEHHWASMLPSYRPQEFTSTALVEAIARAARALARAERPIDLVITTGDNVDSQQRNELANFINLMSGGPTVHPLGRPGDPVISALAAAGLPVPEWATVPGVVSYPGRLEEWARPFVASGMGAPWVACYGNHDGLVQGRAPSTPMLERLVAGTEKVISLNRPLAEGTEPAIDTYLRDPTCFCAPGPDAEVVPVTADVHRRTFRRAEFVRAQLGPGAEDRAYWAHHPHPAVTVLVLDTTNPGGYADGSIGSRQLSWLRRELESAHSRYLGTDGSWVDTDNADRAIVLCSHHGRDTLTNGHVQRDSRRVPVPGQDLPRVLGAELTALLDRFPNVVLWLSGHIHRNRVRPVRTSAGAYWEVATSALVDWPCQARCLDLFLHPDVPADGAGLLRIRARQLDHPGAPDPDQEPDRVLRMASIGRRLAANVFDGVGGPDAEGDTRDRNVDLFVPLSPCLTAALHTTRRLRPTPIGDSCRV